MYVHYGKFKGKPTYPDAINPYLRDTQVFHAYVLTIAISHSCGGLFGLARFEWEIKKRKWKEEEPMKVGNQFWRENEKSMQSANEKSFLPYW